MLQFFRKYQKIFFIVITFVIVISFSFFGTVSQIPSEKDNFENKSTKTISGSSITLKEIKLLSFFLDHGPDDERFPNFLNDFVLQKDVFESPIGHELAKNYFSCIKEELTPTFERCKNYQSYRHPNLEFFSSEMIWNRYIPEINEKLITLKKMNQMDVEYFQNLSDLYVLQKNFPPYLLKSILLQTQDKQKWIEPDPTLNQKDFHLFGFLNASDWFGKSFIDLVSQFILNVSEIAEKNGQGFTFEQAKLDMQKNFLQSIQKRRKVEKSDVSKLFDMQLKQLQMKENQAINLWQKVLNFRHYFRSMQKNILLDQKMWPFILNKVTIEEYHLPKYLQFQTFKDLLKFEIYLRAVFDVEKSESKLDLPTKYLSQSNISKNYPELIERRFTLNVREITQEKLRSNVSIKSLWQWQLNKWDLLAEKFGFVKKDISTRSARFEHLQKLDLNDRQKLDEYSKDQIILENPDRVENYLKTTKPVKMEVGICLSHAKRDFLGIDDYQKLKAHLLSIKDQKSMQIFTDNGKAHYIFEVLEVSEKDEILTFEKAVKTNVMECLLDRFLEKNYAKLKEKTPAKFQDENKNFKPYVQVAEEIGLGVFENIYLSLDTKLMKKGQNPLQFFTNARLVPYLQKLKNNRQNFSESDPLLAQFNILVKERSFTNKDQIYPKAFELSENEWSDVVIDENGPAFFKLIKNESSIDGEELKKSQKILSEELLKEVISDIIHKMIDKKNVIFS